jgi:hypothetical protein
VLHLQYSFEKQLAKRITISILLLLHKKQSIDKANITPIPSIVLYDNRLIRRQVYCRTTPFIESH